jgi:hypothetical protein
MCQHPFQYSDGVFHAAWWLKVATANTGINQYFQLGKVRAIIYDVTGNLVNESKYEKLKCSVEYCM